MNPIEHTEGERPVFNSDPATGALIETDPVTGETKTADGKHELVKHEIVIEKPAGPWQPPLVAAPAPPAPKKPRETPWTLLEEAVAFLLHDHAKHATDPAKAAKAGALLDRLQAEPADEKRRHEEAVKHNEEAAAAGKHQEDAKRFENAKQADAKASQHPEPKPEPKPLA
jgi:hypothetical protein